MGKRIVLCKDKFGKEYQVPKEKLIFRIGVCGILQNETRVFLIKHPRTEEWELPGGGIELGETLEEGLKREFAEETGLQIINPRFLTYREDFYYIENQDAAYHSLRLFFTVHSTDTKSPADGEFVDYCDLNQNNTSELTHSVLKELFEGKT